LIGSSFNKDCIFIGSGDAGQSEFRSTILYHTNTPNWNETFRITLPPEKWLDAHLYFSVKSVSSKTTQQKEKHSAPGNTINYPDYIISLILLSHRYQTK
jgi:hypothetical protein